MIKRAPLKKDPPGKCSRWQVAIYNTETKQKDWHTVRGTKEDARAVERRIHGPGRAQDIRGGRQTLRGRPES
jgi:hypothetical protein